MIHAARTQCRNGCAGCCVDDLTVFAVEAEAIQRGFGELLLEGEPHVVGACAFLDEAGGCRVYAQRPYVCRTQGLPLRWLEETTTGEIVERRDICVLNEAGEPIEDLAESACLLLGPFEERLARLALSRDQSTRRISLRSLFSEHAPGAKTE